MICLKQKLYSIHVLAVLGTFFVIVVVVFRVIVVVPRTDVVLVVGGIERQLQAFERVGPAGYDLRTEGSATVAAAARFFTFEAGHVLTVTVLVPCETVVVAVEVLEMALASQFPFPTQSTHAALPVVDVLAFC